MNMMKKKLTFGLIVGTRAFFNPKLAQQGRKELLEKIESLGYSNVILPENATAHGAIETLADARKCAELFRQKQDDIDGIIVVLPNFGDELGVVQTLALAKLNVPVLVQACNDRLDAVDVQGGRDAFCGKLSVCNNLYQYGIPFTDTLEHTCDIDGDLFGKDIDYFARVCRVVKGLRNARVGAIGAIKGHVAPGDMTYFRISTDDVKGRIKTYLGEGEFTDDPFDMDGGISVCKVPMLRKLLAYMCQNGFEHHVAMTRTHCANALHEAVAKYLKWDIYWHESQEL